MGQAQSIERIQEMLKDGSFSDVTFIVGVNQERIPAHKYALSVTSSVFHSLFREADEDQKMEIRIPEVSPIIFRTFLNHIYQSWNDNDLRIHEKNWAPLLFLSDKYGFSTLKENCFLFVEVNCMVHNSCSYFKQAHLHRVLHLVPYINSQISSHVPESFLSIDDNKMLKEILSTDELNIDEINLFKVAIFWASMKVTSQEKEPVGHEIRKILGPALYAIRFSRMKSEEFVGFVIPMNVLTHEEITKVLRKESSSLFPSHPRIRSCTRVIQTVPTFIYTRQHSVKFQVNRRVKIHGYDNFGSRNNFERICGKIYLKKTNGKGNKDTILGEAPFDGLKRLITYFNEPIAIEADVWYIASMTLDPNSGMETSFAIRVHSKVISDGVQFTFKNDPASEETTECGGLLPIIIFSQID